MFQRMTKFQKCIIRNSIKGQYKILLCCWYVTGPDPVITEDTSEENCSPEF